MVQNKQDIEDEVLKNYPKLIEMCDSFYCEIYQITFKLFGSQDDENKFYQENDFRLTVFTRLMAIVINAKTNFYFLNEFVKNENWVEEYTSNIFATEHDIPYLGYLKDLDTDYRFLFYTQFFSQIESFTRELNRNHKGQKYRKPFNELLALGDNSNTDFICFAEAIRNSIHNNGYFYPYPNQPQQLIFNENTLNYGDNLDFFSWGYNFEFCEMLLNHLSNLIKRELSK